MENNNIIKNDENKPSLRKVIHNIRNMLELTEEEKEFIHLCTIKSPYNGRFISAK